MIRDATLAAVLAAGVFCSGCNPVGGSVKPDPPPAPTRPTITSATTAKATAAADFNYTITASNNPTSYDATGPNGEPLSDYIRGLSIDHTTGIISGSPIAPAGAYLITLKA